MSAAANIAIVFGALGLLWAGLWVWNEWASWLDRKRSARREAETPTSIDHLDF